MTRIVIRHASIPLFPSCIEYIMTSHRAFIIGVTSESILSLRIFVKTNKDPLIPTKEYKHQSEFI